MRRNEHTKIEADSFKLKLPDVFDLEPTYEVDLPNNCKALVYEKKVWADVPSADGHPKRDKVNGWRVFIVNSKGRTPQALRGNYRYHRHDDGGGYETSDRLNVMRFIKDVVYDLTKKKRTSTVEEDPED